MNIKLPKQTYLDGAANTPLDKRVFKAMRPYLKESFVGNSFATHAYGAVASVAIEDARLDIARTLGVGMNEVYFTSGATESNNWIIRSLAETHKGGHIICSAMEHNSVRKVCEKLEKDGVCSVTYIMPDKYGKIPVLAVKEAIQPKTFLCCVMGTNNETGTTNAVEEIGKICKRKKVLLLCDFTQTVTCTPGIFHLRRKFAHADFFTFSGHKIYGPTGVGCLIARDDVPLNPFIVGGSQEFGKRAGTMNTAGVIGLAEACKLLRKEQAHNLVHYRELREYLGVQLAKNGFKSTVPALHRGDHPGIISLDMSADLHFKDLARELALDDICVSAGSACDTEHDSGEYNPSHVLSALSKTQESIQNTIRVSFTKFTTKKDIDRLVSALCLKREGK